MSSEQPFDLMIKQNAGRVINPSNADYMIKQMLKKDCDKFSVDDVADLTGSAHVVGDIYNPAFIRAAARHGVCFYVDSKLNVRRQKVRGVIDSYQKPIVDGKKDPNFYLTPQWFSDLEKFIDNGNTVLLIGPSGCGKSTAVEKIFEKRSQKLLIVSCNASMCADDFEGNFEIVDGNMIFNHADPAVASENGYGLLLDEIDTPPAKACYSLYRLLDGKEMHITRKPRDRTVKRHKNLRIIGTQNTEGRGDPLGLHHGRSLQDEAMLDRWDNIIRVDYPSIIDETFILCHRTGLPDEYSRDIAKAGAILRKATEENAIMFCMTMRRSYMVAVNMVNGLSVADSWNFAILNRVTNEDRNKAREILQRIYGNKFA